MSEPNARTKIETVEQAEAAIEAACGLLDEVRRKPTRMLVSVAMYRLLQGSREFYGGENAHVAACFYRRKFDQMLRITVTSTNPDAPYAVVYAE